jgi:hypothetical protein
MTDLSQIAEPDWNEARRRALVLRPLAHLHSPFKKSFINRKVADQTNGEWHYMLVIGGRQVG